MLPIIAYLVDDKTLKKMEHELLGVLEESYAKKSMRKTSSLIHLLQVLHNYDPDYMDKMIEEALEK